MITHAVVAQCVETLVAQTSMSAQRIKQMVASLAPLGGAITRLTCPWGIKTKALLDVVFFVAFSWLFRGPLLSRKTVFGPFSLLFRGFFVAPVSGKFYAYSPWNSLLRLMDFDALPRFLITCNMRAHRRRNTLD